MRPPSWFLDFSPQIVTIVQSHLIYCLISSPLCSVWFDGFPIVSLPLNRFLIIFHQTHSLTLFQVESHFLRYISNLTRDFFSHFPSVWCSVHLHIQNPLHMLLMLHGLQVACENIRMRRNRKQVTTRTLSVTILSSCLLWPVFSPFAMLSHFESTW